jgi:hypothetical protein
MHVEESAMSDEKSHEKKEPPKPRVPPELSQVVQAGVKAARLVPGAVAVGGTVCSLFAGHRLSYDIDFVVGDLKERFERVRESLESESGWALSRVNPPVLILGSLDRIPIAYRQLRRATPLETQALETESGILTIPTLAEMLRVKAVLACDRRTTRDFYDFAELATLLPMNEVVDALAVLDHKWSFEQRPGVALETMKTLAECEAGEDPLTIFPKLRRLQPRVAGWEVTKRICRTVAAALSKKLVKE